MADTVLSKWSERCSHGRMHGDTVVSVVYNHVSEMLADRGLSVVHACSNLKEIKESIECFNPVMRGESEECTVSVLFDKDEKTAIKTMRTLLDENPSMAFLIVSADGGTPWCKKECPVTTMLQYWSAKDLMTNPTRHRIVPKHRCLEDEEVRKVLSEYSCTLDQLPGMLVTDRIARHYNFGKGDVIEIKRHGFSHEETKYYRRVV